MRASNRSRRAADRDLRKLGSVAERLIMRYLRERIAGSDDPRRFGHALTGDRKGLWRYRVGDYRIVASIEDDRFVVPIALKAIGPSIIHIVDYQEVLREGADALETLNVVNQAVFELVPPVPGIGEVLSQRAKSKSGLTAEDLLKLIR